MWLDDAEKEKLPPHLDTLIQQVHDVAPRHELVNVTIQALRQPREQVQSHDHEVLVRHVHLIGALRVSDALSEKYVF